MSNASDDARSFWIVGPGRGEIRAETLREPTEQEVLVRTLYSGISRGTEALVFNGAVPASEFERMRAPFQGGDFPAPVKYGYISVGHVEEGPPRLQGRVVFCLYPHQTRYVVPAEAVYPVPDDVPAERAVLAANLESAVNGLWDAVPRIGDRIAIVGAGTLGLSGLVVACKDSGLQCRTDRHRSRQSKRCRRAGRGFSIARGRSCRGGSGHSHQRNRGGSVHRSPSRRFRGGGHRVELVRRPSARRGTGRGFPQSTPEFARIASRHPCPCPAGPMDPETPHGARSPPARRFHVGRPDHGSKQFRRAADAHANARDDTRANVVPPDRLPPAIRQRGFSCIASAFVTTSWLRTVSTATCSVPLNAFTARRMSSMSNCADRNSTKRRRRRHRSGRPGAWFRAVRTQLP